MPFWVRNLDVGRMADEERDRKRASRYKIPAVKRHKPRSLRGSPAAMPTSSPWPCPRKLWRLRGNSTMGVLSRSSCLSIAA